MTTKSFTELATGIGELVQEKNKAYAFYSVKLSYLTI